jgi:hypothetical protein
MGRVGGISRVLRHGADAAIAPARAGFLAKFDREADPDGTLDAIERARLSRLALARHMSKLGLARAAKARRAALA